MEKSWCIRDLKMIACCSLEWIFRNIFEDAGIGPDTFSFHSWYKCERTRQLISFFESGQRNHRSIEYNRNILTQSIEGSCWKYLDRLCSRSRKECDKSILTELRTIELCCCSCHPEFIGFTDGE